MDPLYPGLQVMQAAVLPARAVYLIAEGSTSGFIRAVEEASGRWGGMTEPIIPVADSGVVSAEYAEMVGFAEVEAAVNVDVDDHAAQLAAESLGLPLLPIAKADSMATCAPSTVAAPTPQGVSQRLPQVPQYVFAAADVDLWQIAALGRPVSGVHREVAGHGPGVILCAGAHAGRAGQSAV
ncbi:hypothetical protein [Streptomyces mirabilis]|uniref:hypothetical protein n=1 Tax=Streptomyces mirabilis TaxID=68239 RepID=UPI0036BD6C0E